MLENNTLLLIFGLVVTSFYVFRTLQGQPKRLQCPPGPKRLPLIGNLLQLSAPRLWEQAVEWGKDYGDLIYLESLGHRILILNSYEHAKELLVRRSAIYSSRPHSIMATDLEGWDFMTTFTPYGDVLRKHRSYHQRFIGSPETLDYLDIQLRGTYAMLKAILDDPSNYATHVRSLPGSVILMNVYGHRVGKNDRYVETGKQAAMIAGESVQYLFLDALPWLKYIPEWMPWIKFHRVAKEARKVSFATQYELYQVTKEKMARGSLKECMTSVFLSENTREDGSVVDEEVFTGAAATLYLGGADTSVTAIMTFVMQMLKYPGVQQRAQSEIDKVTGAGRLPTFDDMGDMPYVRGVCDEVLRLAVVLTLIPAHSTTEDDVYLGYHIPAGTTVLANAWAMAVNPDYFPEPFAFRPERWLARHGDKESQGPRPGEFAFGFGRRVCPGQEWTENLLFIALSSLLAMFNIEKVIGEDGDPIAPNDEYIPGILRHLGPSQCKFTPRSQRLVSLIESSGEEY